MADYKSVLVKNNTHDCQVTFYVYSSWLSSKSKILSPGTSYLHRCKNEFKFEIKGIYDKKKIILVNARKWVKDVHITIVESETVIESDLQCHEMETAMCIRKINVDKEISLDHGINLYEILKLNFEEVRKLDKDEQDKEIKKAFHREIRRWHSDIAKELGDDEMAHEVIIAYDTLIDRAKRAEYHNKANFNKGWLSKDKWKSIFWSECETKEQLSKYRKRLAMFALSVGVGIGGLVLSICTASLATPAVVGVCGTLGAGFLGGGVQSVLRTINPNSIVKGCDLKCYLISFGLGFVAFAVTGGASVAISAAIAGIGSAATQISAATLTELIAIGSSSTAVGAAACSLSLDAEKAVVDRVKVTWMQVVGHAVVSALIGGITGTAVGAVAGVVGGLSPEISSTKIEGKLVPGLRRYGVTLAKVVSKGITYKSTEGVLGSIARYFEERLDDDLENRPVSEHLKDVGAKVLTGVVSEVAVCVVSTTGEHAVNETKVHRQSHNDDSLYFNNVDNSSNVDLSDINANGDRLDSNTDLNSNDSKDSLDTSPHTLLTDEEQRQRIRCKLDQMSRLTWRSSNVKATYNPPENIKKEVKYSQTMSEFADNTSTSPRFIYMSKGHWISKMIVEYTENGEEHKKKETTSNIALEIPNDAEDVKVFFKVMRFIGVWCDVKKWNRFEKKWYDEPHIFKYEKTPEERRFLLDGSLYFEGVIHVMNERFDDVNEV